MSAWPEISFPESARHETKKNVASDDLRNLGTEIHHFSPFLRWILENALSGSSFGEFSFCLSQSLSRRSCTPHHWFSLVQTDMGHNCRTVYFGRPVIANRDPWFIGSQHKRKFLVSEGMKTSQCNEKYSNPAIFHLSHEKMGLRDLDWRLVQSCKQMQFSNWKRRILL